LLKTVVTFLVGSLFVIGTVYYFLWFQSDINEIKNEVGSTLIQADFLVMKKYDLDEAREINNISADNGFFKNPNKLTLTGNVSMVESKDKNSSKKSRANELFVEFEQKAFQQVIKNAKIKKADANGSVSIQFNDHLIKTETCYYTGKANTIQTQSKVIAEGVKRQITGNEGFIYDLKKETMKMNGKVEGFFGG